MGSHMRYTLYGIDRTTGLQTTQTLDAPNPLEAGSMGARSMVVFDIEPADAPQPQQSARGFAPASPIIGESVRRLAFALCLLVLAGFFAWSAHQESLHQQRLASAAAHHPLAGAPKLASGPPELTRPDHAIVVPSHSPSPALPHPALHAPHANTPAAAAKTA